MTIPSVVQGLIETEDGKVFELDSPKGAAWVEAIGSFRFEPAGDGKPYTVRREGSGYWYGCRKVAGKVRKKYIGKTSEVSTAKLEEIAEALEVPPVARISKVAEVAQGVVQRVAQEVAQDRLTALELEVANLRKALEALQEALPGKLELGDSLELPKVDNEVAEELQNELSNLRNELSNLRNELSNLKAENEKLRADYDALLESSTVVTNKLRQEVQELRSQLEAEKTRGEEIWKELSDTEQILAEVRAENLELKKTCAELRSQLEQERADREEIEAELADLKQKSAAASELPEAADLLNQLKTRRKKSKADLADLEVILEILES
jgi:DNA repair exonuclease SbcCD ATPase subunit